MDSQHRSQVRFYIGQRKSDIGPIYLGGFLKNYGQCSGEKIFFFNHPGINISPAAHILVTVMTEIF